MTVRRENTRWRNSLSPCTLKLETVSTVKMSFCINQGVFFRSLTSGWAGPAAPLRDTGRCASHDWSGTRSGCKRWPPGTSWPGSLPRPVWWRAGTPGRTGSGPRTRTARRRASPGRPGARGSVWCSRARTWKCERFRAGSKCARKLQWVEGDSRPRPRRVLLSDPLCRRAASSVWMPVSQRSLKSGAMERTCGVQSPRRSRRAQAWDHRGDLVPFGRHHSRWLEGKHFEVSLLFIGGRKRVKQLRQENEFHTRRGAVSGEPGSAAWRRRVLGFKSMKRASFLHASKKSKAVEKQEHFHTSTGFCQLL